MDSDLNPVFSSPEELQLIMDGLRGYQMLPYASNSIPGAYAEAVLGQVRKGDVLTTYDFVDVINRELKVGWQVKSTLKTTPVTWKRAKIPLQQELINASLSGGEEDLQRLGNEILKFCNDHVVESMDKYDLEAVGYSRICLTPSEIVYFERELVNRDNTVLFDPASFVWTWSVPKKAVKKEQLPSLHGFRKDTGERWFAWHGLGENQLHFTGEKHWWPSNDFSGRISESRPSSTNKIPFEEFVSWLINFGRAAE